MSLSDDAKVQFAFGLQCLANDDMGSARSSFARVTQLDPQNLRAWLNYGAACGELDLPGEATTAFERARDLDPSSREAASNLGVLRREAGRLAEAEGLFRQVIAMDPAFVFGYYNLAHCFFLAGRFDEAVAFYRAGLKRDPGKTPNQNARLAWALLATGEEKQARRELRRALDRLPEAERAALAEEANEVLTALEAARPGLSGLPSMRRLVAGSLR